MKNWYQQTNEEVLSTLNTTASGLSKQQSETLLAEKGENALLEGKKKSTLQVFLSQFADLLVIILIAAAVISMFSGNAESTIVIIAVIILNAILGTVQHKKAEKSLESLKSLSSPSAKVLRDGQKVEIPSKLVVPGDILLLEAGDLVVADGRILENFSLQVNESALTGESTNVEKTDKVISGEVPLADRTNMVFSSSLVTYGRATVAVTGTGMDTEIGKIAALMNATKEKKTPLQVSLDRFSSRLAIIIMAICAVVFALGLYRKMPLIDSLMFAVALAVAAIPEALSSIVTLAIIIMAICAVVFALGLYRKMPLIDSLMFAVALAVAAIPEALSSIVTIVQAMGTQKMAAEQAVIKELKAVESLGCVSVICSDKTGTLSYRQWAHRRWQPSRQSSKN